MSSGSTTSNNRPIVNLVEETRTKKQLLANLIETVKLCQSRFATRTELATEVDSTVKKLCAGYEAIFLHGIKPIPPKGKSWNLENIVPNLSSSGSRSSNNSTKTFWPLITSIISQTELQRYDHKTDILKQRAWIRISLNEHSLHRYILMILGNEYILNYYETWAFMVDGECNSVLATNTAGLGSILFALKLDVQELDRDSSVDSESSKLPAEAKFVDSSTDRLGVKSQKKPKKKKKVPTTFVSFDDEQFTTTESASSMPIPITSTGPTNNSVNNLQRSNPVISVESDPGARRSSKDTEFLPNSSAAVTGDVQLTNENESSTNDNDNQSESSKIDSEQDSISNVSITSSNFDMYYNPTNRLKPIDSIYQDSDHDLIPISSASAILNTSNSPSPSPVHHNKRLQSQSELQQQEDHLNQDQHLSIAAADGEYSKTITKLKTLLDQQVRNTHELQQQLTIQQAEFNGKLKAAEIKIEGLVRENEILKHQLKMKTMTASTTSTDSIDNVHNTSTTTTNSDSTDDERKLIQVAEMHGELLDFNSYLQTVLKAKEVEIDKLRAELTELVGVSCTTPTNNTFPSPRVLINIWIPSAFLTGSAKDIHHVYQVFIRIRDTEWNVYRRYSQFYALHQQLSKSSSHVSTFPFPPKKRNKTKYVEERRRKLQDYLRSVMNWLLAENKVLADHPGKELLIGLMPFFGEEITSSTKPTRPKKSLLFSSRNRNNSANVISTSVPHQPTYTGL